MPVVTPCMILKSTLGSRMTAASSVRVDVDEAGGDGEAARIDLALRGAVTAPTGIDGGRR